MTDKEKLIDAVKDLKIESLQERIAAKNSNEINYANGLVDQCNKIIILIEKIIPNK